MRGSASDSSRGAGAFLALAASLAACGSFDEAPSDTPDGAANDGGVDAPVDAGPAAPTDGGATDGGSAPRCTASDAFSTPVTISGSAFFESARLGVDGVVYLTIDPTSATSTLGTTTMMGDALGPSTPLLATGSQQDKQPMLSPSGLTLVFDSNRSASGGGQQSFRKLWVARRATLGGAWSNPATLAVDGVTDTDVNGLQDAWIAGARLYFVEAPNNGPHELRWGTFDEVNGRVTAVMPAFSFSATERVDHPVLSADELELFYSQNGRLLHAVRAGTTATFTTGSGTPMPGLTNVSPADVTPTWLSPDGCDLYYFTLVTLGGPTSLYRITRRR